MLCYLRKNINYTERRRSKLQTGEMRVFRLIRGVYKTDRYRNIDIRRELRVTPLLDDIDNSKLRWYDHCDDDGGGKATEKIPGLYTTGEKTCGET